ncbi:hypothetical protein A374_14600 [Fictibacillus macauensis ZFHKF-1]|uniref:N-acetyltransferase domain-containing protein n=1 Tax=Fictibacillus macauensis ZFHKF-1 TaxID=1196324 RepID=I8IYL7_9BACL|nr:GNAT family N-acetyltransferase [Fictibacillus macauensis]EIT84566.1 hypothetical protein A374_14600 [Fictibacillus macauensis ZFHKF-1]
MVVYDVPAHAGQELITKIATLFAQQRTHTTNEDRFVQLLQGITYALSEDTAAGIIVAEQDGDIVGAAFYNIGVQLQLGGRYLWLNDLYVQEEERNQGIARKILLHLIHHAEREGMVSIELETGVNNSVTKYLYNSLDFHDIVSQRYRFNL